MKDIKGYEGLYAVTEEGQVWSYRSNKFLSSKYNRYGYEQVILSNKGEQKTLSVHKLVAEAYIPNPDNKPQVNHKDENKANNNINNLEWVTAKENMNYGTRTQRTQKSVYCVELDKTFNGIREAAKELNLHSTNITKVCKGKQKTTGGYHWRYVENE